MTFIIRIRGDNTKPIVAVYTCPVHGEFDALVQREANGDAPDETKCMRWLDQEETEASGHAWSGYSQLYCGKYAAWTPSPIAGRVKRFEVVRGKYEKPERKTWLDTRKLGEGQDIEEFRDERKKIRDEQRWREIKDETR
jgi:hypothetical protein